MDVHLRDLRYFVAVAAAGAESGGCLPLQFARRNGMAVAIALQGTAVAHTPTGSDPPIFAVAVAAGCRSAPSVRRSAPAPPGPAAAHRRPRSPRRRRLEPAAACRTAGWWRTPPRRRGHAAADKRRDSRPGCG